MPVVSPEADFESREQLTYDQFLDTVKVLKMLYGRNVAERFFTRNKHLWYNESSASISKN